MKSILLAITMIFSTMVFSKEDPVIYFIKNTPAKVNVPTLENKVVNTSVRFEKGNFFSITSNFNQRLLDNFTEKVLTYNDDEMNIYFHTPGGSVIALAGMARIMKNSDIKFTCVASFAASAGFMLFQHCDKRLLLSDGILMSHNWAGGFRDEAPRILTLFNAVQSLVDDLESVAISKMNVNATEYAALINSNLWMPAGLATKYNAIDGIAGRVSCSDELIKERVLTFSRRGYYGRRTSVYKSGCPLIQKSYKRRSLKRSDEFIELNIDLLEHAQKSYKMGKANWIYMGDNPLK